MGLGRAGLTLAAGLLAIGAPTWGAAATVAWLAPGSPAYVADLNPVLLQSRATHIAPLTPAIAIADMAPEPEVTAPDAAPDAAPRPPAAVDGGGRLGWWLVGSLALLASLGGWRLWGQGKQRPPNRATVPADPEPLPPGLASAGRPTLTASPPSDALAADLPLEATTRLTPVDIVDSLVNELTSADGAARRHAIWELGQRGNSDAIQPLVNGLLQADSQEKSLILAALAEISSRSLKPMHRALALGLQDPSPEVRKNAIRDLSRVYDTVVQLSHMLAHASQDPDPGVQETAQWALNQLNRIPAATYPTQAATLDAAADSEGHRLPPS
ncbi:MAG: hypothetical protein EA368_10980 [Leptolyngbya sp. DLM2.Bin27]|nr:MAG: hypothetical protein EA368_10980 [Leptolyngbya sp. DLM2.Bin27]